MENFNREIELIKENQMESLELRIAKLIMKDSQNDLVNWR